MTKQKHNSTATIYNTKQPGKKPIHGTRSPRKITNWSDYNKALVARGNLSVFVDEAIAAQALSRPAKTGKAGHPKEYTDDLILFILAIRELFRLPLRQSIGFAAYLLRSLQLDWPLPDYSTLSRRMGKLSVDFCRGFRGKNVVFLLDSSGFKLYGEGEWKVRKHGIGYRRTWRETHIAIDHETRNIIGLVNTRPSIGDTTQLLPLLEQAKEHHHDLATIIGDGAYDAKDMYLLARELGIQLITPPQKNAVEHLNMYHYQLYDQPSWKERNEVVRRIDEIGRKAWKQEIGYHRRSLVENTFFRLKKVFGENLKSRTKPSQYTEQCIRASLLNRFNKMGLPTYAT